MVMAKLREFVGQTPPRSRGELQCWHSQTDGLNAITRSVAHVERTLAKYPSRNKDRNRLVKAACSLKLAMNDAERSALRAGTSAIDAQLRSMAFDEIAFASRG